MSANIHHSSASAEWYTPAWLIEACRSVLGIIDCDPCSCPEAQEIVKATTWFGEEEDGLIQEWHGNVFMNPPGGWAAPEVAKIWGSRSNAKSWHAKLMHEIEIGHTSNAIELCFNLDSLRSIQPKSHICILKKRCKFDRLVNGIREPGKSPPHGTGLILLSKNDEVINRWITVMSKFGTCYKLA